MNSLIKLSGNIGILYESFFVSNNLCGICFISNVNATTLYSLSSVV